MAILNLAKSPTGVPTELQSQMTDVYNAIWALHDAQNASSNGGVSIVPGPGIDVRVNGTQYIITNKGIVRVDDVGDGYSLLSRSDSDGVFNLKTLIAGENIEFETAAERGLKISAVVDSVKWSALVDVPSSFPPDVHQHALSDVILARRGNPTYKTAADLFGAENTSFLISGGDISFNLDYTITVAAGSCMVREAAGGQLYSYDFPAFTSFTLSTNIIITVSLQQVTTELPDGSVTRVVSVKTDIVPDGITSIELAKIVNINGKFYTINKIGSVLDKVGKLAARDRAVSPLMMEVGNKLLLSTGVARTIQCSAGAIWEATNRHAFNSRDTAVDTITELYGTTYGNSLSSWPNTKYFDNVGNALATIPTDKYSNLFIYSAIDSQSWFIAYDEAYYDTATLAANKKEPAYLTIPFKAATFLIGKLTFLAGADNPFSVENSTYFAVYGIETKLADLPNRFASLVNGKVPETQLPSYVDDVLEFDDYTLFPAVGERGKIYVDCLNNITYRWTGTVYAKIGDGSGSTSITSTDALPEGSVNKYYLDSRARAAFGVSGNLTYNPTTGIFGYVTPASEPPIVAGTSTQYWTGSKTWADLASAVRATVLTGISFATNAAVVATDSILSAIGKIQAHLTALDSSVAGKEPSITAGLAAQYWRGDKTWQPLNSTAVGLGNVENKSSAIIRSEITRANLYNAIPGTLPLNFEIPGGGGSATWVRVCRLTLAQQGRVAKIEIVSHQGYNASVAQDFITTIYFKTGNGGAVDGNGFAGDGFYYTVTATGSTSGLLDDGVKIVANAAGPSATYYDVCVNFGAFNEGTLCTVSAVENASAVTISPVIQSDPGVASATVLVLHKTDIAINGKDLIFNGKYTTLAGYGITDGLAVANNADNTSTTSRGIIAPFIKSTGSIEADNIIATGALQARKGLQLGADPNNGIYSTTADGATWTANNLKIQSWFGIGFACSSSGMPTSGQYSHVFNTRNGDFQAWGNIVSIANIYIGDPAYGTNAERQLHFRNSYGDAYWYMGTDGSLGFWDSVTAHARVNFNSNYTATLWGKVTIINDGPKLIEVVTSASGQQWQGKIASKNSAYDRSVFEGIFYGRPAVCAHNFAESAWGSDYTLWLNTLGQYGGGSVNLPEDTAIVENGTDNRRTIIHDKNLEQYTVRTPNGWNSYNYGVELNNYIKTGFYRGYGFGNSPAGDSGWYYLIVNGHDSDWTNQIAISYGSGNTGNLVYTRCQISSVWSPWVLLNPPSAANQEAWHDVTLPPGWALLNADEKVQYMKDSLGFVHMRGRAQTDTTMTSFTLPVGYRPAGTVWISGVSVTMPGWGATLSAAGVVNKINSGVSYVMFDSVCFRAA